MTNNLILYVGALIFAFTSCAKERTCECTTTNTTTSVDGQGKTTINVDKPTTSTTTYEKAKKSDLGFVCGDVKFSSNSISSSASSTTSYNSTTEKKCVIK